MKVMLLCAGEGTRLRPYTHQLPKPAIPFLTVPLVAYSMEWAREIGPSGVCANTYHLPEKIKALFQRPLPLRVPFSFSDEQPTLLGPGGGLKKAEKFLSGSEDILMMNGDEVFLPSSPGQLKQAHQEHLQSGALATLLVMDHPGVGTKFGGVWTNIGGNVLGFGKEQTPGSKKGWHYTGVIFLNQRIFAMIPPDVPRNILYDDLLQAIAKKETVRIHPVHGFWRETGSPADFMQATEDALQWFDKSGTTEKAFLESLLQRVNPLWGYQKTSSARILCANSRDLEWAAKTAQGFAVIGDRTQLPANTALKSCVIGDNVKTAPESGSFEKTIVLAE